MSEQHPLLLSRKETAGLLGVSLRTLDALVAGKELRRRRIGSRILFARTELERFAQRDHATHGAKSECALTSES